MHLTRPISAVGALTWAVLLIGCSGEGNPRPERTDRERDSLIGQSVLPGAGGVRGALRARDSASARSARLDSIAKANP